MEITVHFVNTKGTNVYSAKLLQNNMRCHKQLFTKGSLISGDIITSSTAKKKMNKVWEFPKEWQASIKLALSAKQTISLGFIT